MYGNKFVIAGLVIGLLSLPACAPSKRIKIKSSLYDLHITAHQYTPPGKGPFPGAIVLHTIAGMQPHVLDFAADLSSKGYVTLAVDYFSGRGGRLPYSKLGYNSHIVDAYKYLKKLHAVDPERIGMVGFSLGPRKALGVAMHPEIKIGGIVSYYVGRLHLMPFGEPDYPPILFLHGEFDQETDPGVIKSFCAAQKRIGKVCEFHIYRAVKHAFTHRSKYGDYDPVTTADAFKRAVAFLDEYVKGQSD